MKIAIVHEMLIKLGGAEKVVERLLKIFPDADLYTLIYDEGKVKKMFGQYGVKIPFITQFVYNVFKNQRFCLPFMPRAIESFDFSSYDLVIASSSWFAHGAITKPETKFIVYSHSPARYMWDWTNEYKRDIWWSKWIKWFILNSLFLKLRQWDFLASSRSDKILANSKNTQSRIKKYHKRDSTIVYPPIEVKRFGWKVDNNIFKGLSSDYDLSSGDYYIIISALTEFKKIEVAIKGFNELKNHKLVIIWDWNYKEELEKMAKNENVIFVGVRYDKELVALVQNSKGLIFPWEEDFWMVPVEVMAAWKPVFAYEWGWLLETVEKWKTWEFFKDKDGKDFVENFLKFDKNNISWKYKDEVCKKQALRFSVERFEEEIKNIVFSW